MLLSRAVQLAAVFVSAVTAAKCDSPCDITHAHRERILDLYTQMWDGNVSLANQIFAPNVSLQIDRFPSGAHGSVDLEPYVTSPVTFAAFVNRTRSSLAQYSIIPVKSAGEGLQIAVRWKMEGVLGKNFTTVPTTLKPGDSVTYNGTEWLTLDSCTGLVEQVDSAQDLITFMYNLGNNINLTPLKAT